MGKKCFKVLYEKVGWCLLVSWSLIDFILITLRLKACGMNESWDFSDSFFLCSVVCSVVVAYLINEINNDRWS